MTVDIAAGECKKATQILESFLTAPYFGNPGKELPGKVLVNAKVGKQYLVIDKQAF